MQILPERLRGGGVAFHLRNVEERLRRFAGVFFLAPPSSPLSLLSFRWRRIGRSGGGLRNGLGRGRLAGRSWGDWSVHGLVGRCVARWMSVHHVLKVAAGEVLEV